MKKLIGLKVGEYEIVDPNEKESDEFTYEDVSLEEILNRCDANQDLRNQVAERVLSVNIHQLLCEETYEQCMQVMRDSMTDPRLKDLKAIVFLLMKPKGDRNVYHQLRDPERYRKLIDFALNNGVAIGFDSCSAPSFLKAIEGRKEYEQLAMSAEPCESNCFSSYVNVDGRYFHCSFTEGEDGWQGVDLLQVNDFMKDVWNSPEVQRFRGKLLDSQEKNGCRSCPVFNLDMEEKGNEGSKRICEQQLVQLVRDDCQQGSV